VFRGPGNVRRQLGARSTASACLANPPEANDEPNDDELIRQVPMVIRGPGGVGRQLGAEHSQRLQQAFASKQPSTNR